MFPKLKWNKTEKHSLLRWLDFYGFPCTGKVWWEEASVCVWKVLPLPLTLRWPFPDARAILCISLSLILWLRFHFGCKNLSCVPWFCQKILSPGFLPALLYKSRARKPCGVRELKIQDSITGRVPILPLKMWKLTAQCLWFLCVEYISSKNSRGSRRVWKECTCIE